MLRLFHLLLAAAACSQAADWYLFTSFRGNGDSGVYLALSPDGPARLWFDPGFNCIDATLVRDGKRWVMVFKDERRNPLQKKLRLAFAGSPAGPWRGVTEPFTARDWIEGPTVARVDGEWWIYFDHYAKPQFMGAVRTRDWRHFEDISDQLHFPAGSKHGTVVKIPESVAQAFLPVLPCRPKSTQAGMPVPLAPYSFVPIPRVFILR
jgi:hypothetical protein